MKNIKFDHSDNSLGKFSEFVPLANHKNGYYIGAKQYCAGVASHMRRNNRSQLSVFSNLTNTDDNVSLILHGLEHTL